MKIFTKILLLTLVLNFAVAVKTVDAQTPTMNASWESDYSDNMEIVINFVSPANYTQQVSVVMYSTSLTGQPGFGDFRRVAEATAVPNVETVVTLKLSDDLTENGGKYKIKIQGNGTLASQCVQILDVNIFTPYNAGVLLGNINRATENSDIIAYLNEAKEELQLIIDDATKIEYFKYIRDIDYNGSFKNLNDVKNAYIIAGVLAYLQSENATIDNICEQIEVQSKLIGFDIAGVDYTANKSKVLERINASKTEYENQGILTTKILKKALNEMVAVCAINECQPDDLHNKIEQYKGTFGITDSSFNTYLGMNEESRQLVLRQVYDKNFGFKEQIKAAFETGVENINSGMGSTQTPGGDEDDSSDRGSFGSGGVSISGVGGGKDNETPEVNNDETLIFADLPQTHWAFNYIKGLHEAGSISGYADNTFKPDDTVKREEFVKMIISAVSFYDQNAESDFEDVSPDHWAFGYISSASQKSIISGINKTTFGLGNPITREDVAVITARIIDYFNNSYIEQQQDIATEFVDDYQVADYAKASVKMLVNEGIVSGFEDNSFKPKDYLTRAQSAKIIYMLRASLS